MASPTVPSQLKQRHTYQERAIPAQNTRARQPFWSSWVLEFGALGLSVASLSAAAAVLSRYDGRRLDDWGPGFFSISLNAAISVLGVIAKANLAFVISSGIGQHKWNWFRGRQDKLGVFNKFEQASRGPWGSADLLLWSKISNWAALGCLVTLTALLVDPFLQATVSIRGQTDITASNGSLPLAHAVNLGTILVNDMSGASSAVGNGEGDDPLDAVAADSLCRFPDFGVTSAVLDGLNRASLGPDMGAQMVRFVCNTGNCTWPLYTTAAVCSRCNDVSQQITKRSGQTDYFGQDGTDRYLPVSGSSLIVDGQANYTSYRVAYAHIKQFDGLIGGYPDFAMSNLPTEALLTSFMNTNYLASASFRDMNTTIATVLIMRIQDDFRDGKVAWQDSPPVATECGLYMCAKAYTASAVNGVLKESEVGSWAVREPRSWRASDHMAHNMTGDGKAAARLNKYDRERPTFFLNPANWDMLRTDLQVVIPEAELEAGGIPPGEAARVQTRFNISQATVNSMSLSLRKLFNEFNNSDEGQKVAWDGEYFKAVYPSTDQNLESLISDIFWVSNDTAAAKQNLSTVFEPLANRLTMQLRESSNITHQGRADAFVLHFHVNWGFFSMLVATLALGTLFFVGVLIQTYRLGLPAWKESAVPTLVYGLDDETQSLLRKIDSGRWTGQSIDQPSSQMLASIKEMTKSARERVRDGVMVKLEDDVGDGYSLQMRPSPLHIG